MRNRGSKYQEILEGATMIRLETRLTTKGQVTVPAEIRRALGLKAKDKVRFEMEDGEVKLKLASSAVLASYGAFKTEGRPKDWKELREEFEIGVAEEAAAEG